MCKSREMEVRIWRFFNFHPYKLQRCEYFFLAFFLPRQVFTLTKLWCYRVTSLIFALPLAVCCGVNFACASFCRIWCCIPCFRCCDLELLCVKRFWDLVLQSFLAPCCDAYGRILSHIRIRLARGTEWWSRRQGSSSARERLLAGKRRILAGKGEGCLIA